MAKLSPETILKKPYARILTPEEGGGFSAEILEFPGCFAEGETPNETFEALERVAKSWIEAALEQGQSIPEPSSNVGFGGKFALRLPRSLHRQAARLAQRDNTSLNQFLTSSVASRIGAEEFYDKLIERMKKEIGATYNITANLTSYTNVAFTVGSSTGAPQQIKDAPSIEKKAVTEAQNG